MTQSEHTRPDRRRLIRIPAGTIILRRADGKADLVRRDMTARALPTTLAGGDPGWCFRRRRRELWCCPAEDAVLVAGPP